jgi:hypothetical protein
MILYTRMCIFPMLIKFLPGAALVMVSLFGLSGCSYLDSAFKQAYLAPTATVVNRNGDYTNTCCRLRITLSSARSVAVRI